jgi:hypothetical protein
MKKKYLIAGAVVGLALMTGAAAFAQTNTMTGNNNTSAPAAVAPATGTQGAGMMPGLGNNAMHAGLGNNMIGRYGGFGGGSNVYGRRMTGGRTLNMNNSPVGATRFNTMSMAWRMFAMVVTTILFWIILVMVIFALGLKVKKMKQELKK